MKKHLLALSAVLLLLSGCASSVTKDIMIDAEADPKANFAGYTSYRWLGSAAIVYDPEGQWEPPQFDADAEIRFLIDRELRKRGMTEAAGNADMIVAYAAGIDMSSMDIKVDPESKLSTLENVPAGALTVILIDSTTGLAIWGGVATAEVQQNPDQEITRQRLDFAVSSMFKKLPK
jgi:Domain of unknown function (DUF4136)